MRMKKFILLCISMVFMLMSNSLVAQATPFDRSYHVVWNTPSKNASESMPVGGGDIGCNVWVESGDVMLYIQRSGCFSENGEYLKLGRIRLSFSPNPFDQEEIFKQELVLKDGYVCIESKGKLKENSFGIKLKVWIDQFTHSVHISAESEKKTEIKASYENWRFADRLLTDQNRGRFGCFGLEGYPGEVIKKRDSVKYENNRILFFHRNAKRTLSPDVMINQQGLDAFRDDIVNNISNLTFGGYLFGNNLLAAGETAGIYNGTPYKSWMLKSKEPARRHHISISTHIQQTETLRDWQNELDKQTPEIVASQGNFIKNKNWWNAFWERSWIVTDPMQKGEDSLYWQMGRNYQLFRYQLGCNLSGEYPTKFNGGNFTVDPLFVDKKMTHDPDWRAWGGDVFTAQNQRLVYWPLLKSGDAEGLKSQFNLYEKGLSGACLKVKEHFGHDGAMFCEYANAAGLDFGAGWGWSGGNKRLRGEEIPFGDPRAKAINTYNEPVEKGIMANGSIAYHWESQVEHTYMMLEYHRFTGKSIDRYMPFIKKSLIFFDQHYQKRQQMRTGRSLDENGTLVFFPSTSCESYRGATNPADLISGIAACLESLLTIESDSVSIEDKRYFKSYLQRLPGLRYDTIEGDRVLKPADSFLKYQNVECPQFYPLFPFNRFDINSKEIAVFKNTWKHGTFPKNMVQSWHQDGIFFARMGMKEEAMEYNKRKLQNANRRFPTFWGPGHDWVPDHNWGGSGMIGLQEMLLQTVGNKIYILPAWPKGKDVAFKLHAPQNTTVEIEYIDGKITKMQVYPVSRKKDIQVMMED